MRALLAFLLIITALTGLRAQTLPVLEPPEQPSSALIVEQEERAKGPTARDQDSTRAQSIAQQRPSALEGSHSPENEQRRASVEQPQTPQHQDAKADENPKTTDWLQAFAAVIQAATAIAVAIFTWSLVRTTNKMWAVAERQAADLEQSVEVARQSSVASEKAADAAVRAVELSRFVARTELRAYLTIGSFDIKNPEGEDINQVWPIYMNISNQGKTPARNVANNVNMVVDPKRIEDDFHFQDIGTSTERGASLTIGPNGGGSSGPHNLTAGSVGAIFRKTMFGYIYGWVEYDDIFEDTPRRRMEFCYQILVEGQGAGLRFSITAHTSYNNNDGDCRHPPKTEKGGARIT